MSRTPFSSGSPAQGRIYRPRFDVLEDRLAPGSLLESSWMLSSGDLLAAAQRRAADIALGVAQSANQQAATQTTSPVVEFNNPSVVRGSSTLIRTDNGISMHLTTSGLKAGAYSVWWVIFETPGATPKVGNATGGVVGPNGTATFAAHLNEGETLVGHPLFSGGSLQDARTAEIRIVIRFHGPADPGRIHEQTRTFEPGVGVDAQITIHKAP